MQNTQSGILDTLKNKAEGGLFSVLVHFDVLTKTYRTSVRDLSRCGWYTQNGLWYDNWYATPVGFTEVGRFETKKQAEKVRATFEAAAEYGGLSRVAIREGMVKIV